LLACSMLGNVQCLVMLCCKCEWLQVPQHVDLHGATLITRCINACIRDVTKIGLKCSDCMAYYLHMPGGWPAGSLHIAGDGPS